MRNSSIWKGFASLHFHEWGPTPICPRASWFTAGALTTASMFLSETGHPFISLLLGFLSVLLVLYGAILIVVYLSAILRK